MGKYCRTYAYIYNEFYDKFLLISKNYAVHPFKLMFNEKRQEKASTELVLQDVIHLKQWPRGINDHSREKIDISIEISIYCAHSSLCLSRSSVCVTYYKRVRNGKNKAMVFENIRFDYHPEQDDRAHPIFHAHIFCSKKPDSVPKSLIKNFPIEWGSISDRFNNFRIPVPNMTLPSVLCCLVGTHLGSDKLQELLDMTRKARKPLHDLDIPQAQFDIFKDNSFAGAQWFERPKVDL